MRYSSERPLARRASAWFPAVMAFRKTYVEVTARIDVDGRLTPLEIVWRDGRIFAIDRVHEASRRASQRVGGTGIRYLVSVNGRET